MTDYRNFKRAFKITTSNNTYSTDEYVVIAYSFAEAEDIYWKELHGYNDIISIEAIRNVAGVAYREYTKDITEKSKSRTLDD